MLKPRESTIRVTNACNARCKMCKIWQEEQLRQFDINLINKLPNSLRNINLSGGEPFLRDDLPEIVYRLKDNCPNCRIVISTNGILTDIIIESMKKILKIDPKIVIRISMDGIGKIHDEIRGVENAYYSVISTLKYIKKLKIKDIGIAITVSDINIKEVAKVYTLSKEEKVKFNCQVAHNSDFYFGNNTNIITKKGLFEKELERIITYELLSFNFKRLFKAYYYSGLWNYVSHLPRTCFCDAGSAFFYLNQEGCIYPCIFLNERMGNLNINNFSAIWQSGLANKIREQVEKCKYNCWTICTVAPTLKNTMFPAVRWVVNNKPKAHFGKYNLS